MMMLRRYKRAALGMVFGAGVSGIIGCGDDLPKRYPVYGTVSYNGKSLESGTITFTPDDLQKGRSAGSTIKDGQYSLNSLTTDDGALAGHYKVSLISRRTNTDSLDPRLKMMYEKAHATGGVPIPAQVKKKITVEDLVPKKYADPATSGLQAEVRETSNKADFDLTD
jgi:hypothetical protein